MKLCRTEAAERIPDFTLINFLHKAWSKKQSFTSFTQCIAFQNCFSLTDPNLPLSWCMKWLDTPHAAHWWLWPWLLVWIILFSDYHMYRKQTIDSFWLPMFPLATSSVCASSLTVPDRWLMIVFVCRYKLDGDTQGWLELDAATGEIRTKEKLDREKVDSFKVTVTAFEKGERSHCSTAFPL